MHIPLEDLRVVDLHNSVILSTLDGSSHLSGRWSLLRITHVDSKHGSHLEQQGEGTYLVLFDKRRALHKCINTEQFEALKRLGPKIITFVVYKLAKDVDQHTFYGVFLYNAIENDPEYRVEPGPKEGITSTDSLQILSSRIVELNYQRNQIFETRVQAWSQFHRDNWLRASSLAFTMTDEYFDLVDMGTSIIAPVMVSYYHWDWGYWWQLLHEIIHGRQVGAYSYQPGAIYEACVQWFNEGDHADAPLYEQTQEDKRFFGEPWGTKNNETAP